MLICGLKLTHDAAVALLKDGVLVGCIELEKINNNARHSHLTDTEVLKEIVESFGYSLKDIDQFVIDGWKNTWKESVDGHNYLSVDGQWIQVAPYSNVAKAGFEKGFALECARFDCFDKLSICGREVAYSSYSHLYTHLAVAYCTSPFAKRGESCFISVFDGGSKPTLFYYDATKKTFIFCEEYVNFGGHIYDSVASLFRPYATDGERMTGRELILKDIAGKVMAYIALGKCKAEYKQVFYDLYEKVVHMENTQANRFQANQVFNELVYKHFGDADDSADILASFHEFLKELLVDSLEKAVKRSGFASKNFCMSGGCALNIKWNCAIRDRGIFDEIFVPPFTNDSGSAIGCVCAEWMNQGQQESIQWSVYCGVEVKPNFISDGWTITDCSVETLAKLLYETGEPVVVLTGRTEGGPRALGGRSILCDARSIKAKEKLNEMKRREFYRPVAPICLEEDSKEYFVPGGSDKYMLFEHQANEFACQNVPAIVHLDGSSRLQTIAESDQPTIYQLLKAYKALSGISVLCNTSANKLRCGFFPDVKSAQEWGRCKYIWSEGKLYSKQLEKGE